ncbi:MAG TPA: hypothetical protein VLC09_21205, partial [Polyangiaceae bacterium]|nr:hypothetical protein [Polyangiaceae bacterium]
DLLPPKDSKDSYRPRYSEVAAQMGCFQEGAEPALRIPPVEQLWRDHLLAGAILIHSEQPHDEGYFVLVHPEINEACTQAVASYRACLSNDDTFKVWTLDAVVEALLEHADYDWAWTIRDRYVDFYRVDHAYQDHYVAQTTASARTVRIELSDIQAREGHRVWFRPSSSGFAMVGLLPGKPQLGTSYDSTNRLRGDFEAEFAVHCDGPGPKRVTPEKALQSFLVSSALANGRQLESIDESLVFLTDELVIPSIYGDQRLDVLALRRLPDGARLALVELKSERALTELLRQTRIYAEFLDNHRDALAGLASAILGEDILITEPCERWVIWPSAGSPGPDPRTKDFADAGVRVVSYRIVNDGFGFDIGPELR